MVFGIVTFYLIRLCLLVNIGPTWTSLFSSHIWRCESSVMMDFFAYSGRREGQGDGTGWSLKVEGSKLVGRLMEKDSSSYAWRSFIFVANLIGRRDDEEKSNRQCARRSDDGEDNEETRKNLTIQPSSFFRPDFHNGFHHQNAVHAKRYRLGAGDSDTCATRGGMMGSVGEMGA